MPDDRVTVDVFRVALLAPPGLADAAYAAMDRAVDRRAFRRALRRAAERLCHRSPALARATVRVTR